MEVKLRYSDLMQMPGCPKLFCAKALISIWDSKAAKSSSCVDLMLDN